MVKKTPPKKTSILLRFFNWMIAPFAWLLLFAMLISVTAAYFDPEKFVAITLLGLSFWGLWFINLALLFILILFRSKIFYISIFTLVISIFGLNLLVAIQLKPGKEKELRILSYNVHGFKGHDKKSNKAEMASEIINFLQFQDADLVCIQEFEPYSSKNSSDLERFSREAGYAYHAFKPYWGKSEKSSGLLILSKNELTQVIPIQEKGKRMLALKAAFQTKNGGENQWIVNTHLVSFSLQQKELSFIGEARFTNKENIKAFGVPILGKLTAAFRIRGAEIKQLTNALKSSDEPMIVCGDFNDTPLSYTHRQMRLANFTDSYLASGNGIGSTYAGLLPFLRIDYIWLSRHYLAQKSKVPKNSFSDHYALISEVKLSK